MSHTAANTLPTSPVQDNFSDNGSGSGSGSGDDSYEIETFKSVIISQVIYLSFVGVIGTIANIIVICRGVRNKNGFASFGSHRNAAMNTTNMLVISLAVSNLGTSTFSVGIFIFPIYVKNVPINDFTCRFIWPLRELFTAVACYSFTFIAVGRYLILFKSFRNAKVFSSPTANNVALWIFCYLIFALPFATAYKPYNLNGTWLCDTFWESHQARRWHVTFLMIFNSFTPTFLVSVSYLGIVRRLKRARNIVTPVSAIKSLPGNHEPVSFVMHSHRAVRISLLLLISFIISFIPYGILMLCVEYNNLDADTFPQLETIHAIAFCLLHSGAMIDPLIIMLGSKAYRPYCCCSFKRNCSPQ